MSAELLSSGPLARRGFLRGLVRLPLIGGGLALSGAPTAVAIPPDLAMLHRYCSFLVHEHATARAEWCNWRSPGAYSFDLSTDVLSCWREATVPYCWFPHDTPDIVSAIRAAPPSSRAALVLSAANLPLATALRRDGA
jgi:hypothetical protein